MQITIEPTDEFTVVNGATVRRWVGMTQTGVWVKVFVALVAARAGDGTSEFDHVLRQIEPPPGAESRAIPLRMIL
jgi:hypothetical protein